MIERSGQNKYHFIQVYLILRFYLIQAIQYTQSIKNTYTNTITITPSLFTSMNFFLEKNSKTIHIFNHNQRHFSLFDAKEKEEEKSSILCE